MSFSAMFQLFKSQLIIFSPIFIAIIKNIEHIKMKIYVAGLMEVIIYSSPDDKKKNRGFCFLEYESHKAASLAKRRLGTGRIKVIFSFF